MIDPVTSMNGLAPPQTKAKSEFDMETFLRLLTVQLSTQNPLEPMNDRDFFAQLAQLGQVDGLAKLQSSVEAAEAAGMIGKTVTAIRPQGDVVTGSTDMVTGQVEKVMVRDGKHYLVLNENGGRVEVTLDAVREVGA